MSCHPCYVASTSRLWYLDSSLAGKTLLKIQLGLASYQQPKPLAKVVKLVDRHDFLFPMCPLPNDRGLQSYPERDNVAGTLW